MQSAKLYVKDTSYFLRKQFFKELRKVPNGAILVTADFDLYPSIPRDNSLDALSEKLETCQDKKIAKEDLLRWINLF